MDVLIKPEFIVRYDREMLESDFFYVNFFSECDYEEDNRFYRKYLDEISKRRYYKSGRKKWFYKIMWRYVVRIPKEMLEIDAENCLFSYIHYKLRNSNLLLINSTSASTGGPNGSIVAYQGININHCISMKKRDITRLLSFALENEETFNTAASPVHFNGNYSEIMFIAKYAPNATNYNKSTYHANKMRAELIENRVARAALSSRVNKESLDYLEELEARAPEHFRENQGEEMLEDLRRWKDVQISDHIPYELYQSLKKISNYSRRRKRNGQGNLVNSA